MYIIVINLYTIVINMWLFDVMRVLIQKNHEYDISYLLG